jgi:predicted Rossmann fold nucleotide-binding protein DprA/Smf involved in DNA uptake
MQTPETIRAALLLTNRLVQLGAAPLAAREFWHLVDQVDPGDLLGLDPDGIAERLGAEPGAGRRIRALLDAATAMGFEQERLHDGGIDLISALDDRFPAVVRDRLGAACPPFLLCAGPLDRLGAGGLAIVGSGEPSMAALEVAREVATLAAARDWPVVTGLEPGVELEATLSAAAAGGAVIGVPAKGILRASRKADVRKLVHTGSLSLASPYPPDAAASERTARGRDRIVHALASRSFAVAVADGEAGRPASAIDAIDAIDQWIAPVAVWVGDGAPAANRSLAERGATPITDPIDLFDLDRTDTPPEGDSRSG